ncbi:MAG: c-type cytochrome [Myxococcota bacterium]
MHLNRTLLPAVLLAAAAWLFPLGALAGDAAAGKEKYTIFCVTCHGETGKGDGPGGAGLQPPPRDFSTGDFKFDADGNGTPGEDADLRMVIAQGAAAFGGSPLMTPWGGTLTDEDIDNLVAVIHSLKE